MENCCLNNYWLCGGLEPCFETMAVKVPLTYSEPYITLQFFKNAMGNELVIKIGCVIDGNGWATFDADAFPDGYFNPYGTNYSMKFLSDATGAIIDFIAEDGKPYSGLSFAFNISNDATTYTQLNIFNDDNY